MFVTQQIRPPELVSMKFMDKLVYQIEKLFLPKFVLASGFWNQSYCLILLLKMKSGG